MILKQNQIFNNITLASRPRVIKVSPKSDMSIIWIDIWDVQSSSKATMLINRCFNVGRYIVTIWGANMNPGIPQCKNCWKWDHATFSCRVQGSRYIKCNGPHKSENHREFGWCCKANKKSNPSQLETKKEKPCLLRSLMVDFILFFSLTLFFFSFFFYFLFSIFRTTQVRVYQSRCHISHKSMA